MIRFWLRSSLLTLVMAIPVFGQSGTIRGKVVDKQTRQPIPQAAITLINSWQYAVSDDSGKFELSGLKAGSHSLQVLYIGYRNFSRTVTLKRNEILELSIFLAQAPLPAEEIVVTASREHAILQTDISENQIRERNPSDVGELFKGNNGFGIIRKGGYAVDPVLRAFKYEQLNMQFDGGVRVSPACPNRMDPVTTHISAEDLEKVEIVKGPFTVRYGQTLGGVINLIMKRPAAGERFRMRGEAESGFESNGSGKRARLALTASHPHYDMSFSAGSKRFGDYQNGEGLLIPSSFRVNDYSLKLGINGGSKHRFQLSWRQSFARDVLHAGLPMDTRRDDTHILAIDYTGRNLSTRIISSAFKIYFTGIEHEMDNERRPNYAMTHAVSRVSSRTAGGRMELGMSWLKNNVWYAGADYYFVAKTGVRDREMYRNACTGTAFDPPRFFQDDVWQDSRIRDLGVFSEWHQRLSQKVLLVWGARVDFVSSEADHTAAQFLEAYGKTPSQRETNLNLTASVHFRPTSATRLNVALGRGTRTPNLIERYINHFSVGQDAYEYFGDPRLKPEANHQIELSLSRESNRIAFSASVFYSFLKNYISAEVDENLPRLFMPCKEPLYSKRFRNINRATQAGLELSLWGHLQQRIHYRAELFYTRGKNLDWRESLPEIPPLEGNLSLRYRPTSAHYWFQMEGRFVADQNQYATSFGESRTAGFSVFNLLCGVKPLSHLEITAGVENLFDKTYFEHLNRRFVNSPLAEPVYEPGRNFTINLRIHY